jgi:putative lipoic acid-binding regulatory protein
MVISKDKYDLSTSRTVEISYPTKWEYKVICLDISSIKDNIYSILSHRKFDIHISQQSSSKKYISFNVNVLVTSDDDRVNILELLKKQNNVKFVL